LPTFKADNDTNKLKVLKFSNNLFYHDWSGGIVRFAMLKYVQYFSLAKNYIGWQSKKVTCEAFYGLLELVTLDLSHNSIETFVCGYGFVPSLKTLRLNNNKLTTLSILPKYSKLSYLFLQHNNLKIIEFSKENCNSLFQFGFTRNWNEFKHLKVMNLSGNTELKLTGNEFINTNLVCLLLDTEILDFSTTRNNLSEQFQSVIAHNITILKQKNIAKKELSGNSCEAPNEEYKIDHPDPDPDHHDHPDIMLIVGSSIIGVLLLVIMILFGILIKKRAPAPATLDTPHKRQPAGQGTGKGKQTRIVKTVNNYNPRWMSRQDSFEAPDVPNSANGKEHKKEDEEDNIYDLATTSVNKHTPRQCYRREGFEAEDEDNIYGLAMIK
jgi:hypothetical protein